MDSVRAIWCDVLEIPEVGSDENFFDIGGHSLLLQLVQSRLAERTGRDLPLVELFNHPTVRSLVDHLNSGSETGRPVRVRRTAGAAGRLAGRRARLGGDRTRPQGDLGD
ncbi:phosphopantetheine-binding protein [Streptomyces sp. NPDC051576]|uniref:phosphopantetheine-binding protein n=1 Tax=Streptomyces sp. NPDC051576 TaxID=3155803 RepID=UPI00342B0D07